MIGQLTIRGVPTSLAQDARWFGQDVTPQMGVAKAGARSGSPIWDPMFGGLAAIARG